MVHTLPGAHIRGQPCRSAPTHAKGLSDMHPGHICIDVEIVTYPSANRHIGLGIEDPAWLSASHPASSSVTLSLSHRDSCFCTLSPSRQGQELHAHIQPPANIPKELSQPRGHSTATHNLAPSSKLKMTNSFPQAPNHTFSWTPTLLSQAIP